MECTVKVEVGKAKFPAPLFTNLQRAGSNGITIHQMMGRSSVRLNLKSVSDIKFEVYEQIRKYIFCVP